MDHPHDPERRAPTRRAFLRLAVLAPVAVAGCATATGGASRQGGGGRESTGAAQAAASEPSAAELLRAVPLAMDVEPAFTFRARGGA